MWQNYTNGIDWDNCKVDIFQNTPTFIYILWCWCQPYYGVDTSICKWS